MGKVVTNVEFNASLRFISWEVMGEETERYHINLKDTDSRWPHDDKIMKNSKAKYRTPGYHDTRRLDAIKPGNAKMIADVFVIVDRDQLMTKAVEAFNAKQAADDQAMTERAARLQHARKLFMAMRNYFDGSLTKSITLTPDDMRALLEYAPQPEDQ